MNRWVIAAVILVGVVILSSCSSTATSPGVALPAIPQYSEKFRMAFADEVDHICGNPQKNMKAEHEKSCIFIQDALILRKQLKALSGGK